MRRFFSDPLFPARIIGTAFVVWCVLWLIFPGTFGIRPVRQFLGVPVDGYFGSHSPQR